MHVGPNGQALSVDAWYGTTSKWFDADVERGLLGAAIGDPECLALAVEALTADDFGRDNLGRVWCVIREMHAAGRAVDYVLLGDELERRGLTFPECAGESLTGVDMLLGELREKAALPHNVPGYVAKLKEHTRRRALADVSDQIHEMASNGTDTAVAVERIRAALDLVERQGIARRGYQIDATPSDVFAATAYPRRWIVDDVLVEGQPGGLIGPKKSMKTTLAADLAISAASATPFLGTFRVERPVRTLILSGESGAPTLQETAHRICEAKGFGLDELGDKLLWAFNMPRLSNATHLSEITRFAKDNLVELALFDPLYLMLLSGSTGLDASNMFHVGPILAAITEACLSVGCTPLLVHHFRRNREAPHELPELDDVAYAGTTEFLRQWILTGRREPYLPGSGRHPLWLVVGGSSGQSGAWAVDVNEGTIDHEFRGRAWNVSVRWASEAQQANHDAAQEARAAKAVAQAKAKEDATARRVGELAAEAMKVLRQIGPMTQTDWRRRLRLSGENFGPVRLYLLDSGQIRECMVDIVCNNGTRPVPGYESADGIPGYTRTQPDDTRTTPGLSECGTPDRTPGQADPPYVVGGLPTVRVSGCPEQPTEAPETDTRIGA